VLIWYQIQIGGGNITPSILMDYVIADSLYSGIDSQVMKNIAKCESGFRQFEEDGTHLISPTSDVGLMQINQIHWKRAKSLGLDIFNSPIDNWEMGKLIYKERGFSAWACYKK